MNQDLLKLFESRVEPHVESQRLYSIVSTIDSDELKPFLNSKDAILRVLLSDEDDFDFPEYGIFLIELNLSNVITAGIIKLLSTSGGVFFTSTSSIDKLADHYESYVRTALQSSDGTSDVVYSLIHSPKVLHSLLMSMSERQFTHFMQPINQLWSSHVGELPDDDDVSSEFILKTTFDEFGWVQSRIRIENDEHVGDLEYSYRAPALEEIKSHPTTITVGQLEVMNQRRRWLVCGQLLFDLKKAGFAIDPRDLDTRNEALQISLQADKKGHKSTSLQFCLISGALLLDKDFLSPVSYTHLTLPTKA